MMIYKRLAFYVVAVLLLSLPMFGQYQGTTLSGVEDNPADCANSTGVICWSQIDNTAPGGVKSLSAAMDFTVYALDESYEVWSYNYTNFTWTEQTGLFLSGKLRQIAVSSNVLLYAVSNEASNNVYTSTGSSWTHLSGSGACLQIAVTYDNSLWCLNASGYLYSWSGGVWTRRGAPGALQNLAVSHGGVIGVGFDGNIYGFDGTSFYNGGTKGFTPLATAGAIAYADDHTIVMLDNSNNVWLSRDGGNTFTEIYDSYATVVTAGNAGLILKGGPSHAFHYTGTMPAAIRSTTGSFQGYPGCNPPGYHLGTSGASFPHGLHSGSTQAEVIHTDQMNVVHEDYSPSCDPVFTFSNPECNAALTSTVTCPVMGTLLSVSDPTNYFSLAYMQGMYKRVAGPPALGIKEFFTGLQYYDYPITPWCSNGTPNPVITAAEDTADHNYWTVLSGYEGSAYSGKWTLIMSKSIGLAGPEAPVACTLTPQPLFDFGTI